MTLTILLNPNQITDVENEVYRAVNNLFPLMWDEEFENVKDNYCKNLCAICLATKCKNKTLNCNHTFCEKCIGKWLKYNSRSCPKCRKKI